MRTDSSQDLGIVDPPSTFGCGWEMAHLKRDSLPEALQPPLQSIDVKRCIASPARRDLEETRWLRELAETFDFVKGLAGWAGLCLAALLEQWKVGSFGRHLDAVFETFTPRLLTIGSAWPVCVLSGDYASPMHFVIDHVQQFQPRLQSGMLGENCAPPMGLATVLSRSSQ